MNIDELTIAQAKELAAFFNVKTTGEKDIALDMIGCYCLIRTFSAGVHAGILKSRNGREVVLVDSRRIWYWKGAASLSQLAKDGTANPDECRFSVFVDEILLTETIEIIKVARKAEKSIREVHEWTTD